VRRVLAAPKIEIEKVTSLSARLEWTVPGSQGQELSFDIQECHPDSSPPCLESGLPNDEVSDAM
jgi:hypothetical protein